VKFYQLNVIIQRTIHECQRKTYPYTTLHLAIPEKRLQIEDENKDGNGTERAKLGGWGIQAPMVLLSKE